jgi:hypothetical protein
MMLQSKLFSAGLPLLLSIALSFQPMNAEAQAQEKINIGCRKGITNELSSVEQANRLLSLKPYASLTELVRIAAANCILKQEWNNPSGGDPSHSELAYGVKGWSRCYIKVTTERPVMHRTSRVKEVKKICL